MGKEKNRLVSCSSAYRMFFIKPPRGPNASSIARRLIGIRSVVEVMIAEGDFGFVVKANPAENRDELESFIEKNFDCSKVVCHYRYGK